MDVFSMEFVTALLSIVVMDLVLAGDNAIVIGLAAKRLPKEQQKKAIIWGTVGAILIRSLATIVVVYLLKIPGLLLIGGLTLLWISYKLMTEEDNHEIKTGNSFWSAIRTIVIADAAMGLDNVLAVAGAAHGNFLLVILGLIISIPIVILGSTIILRFMEKYPIIIFIGAAVVAWTATKMIVKEPFLQAFFENNWLQYSFEFIVVIGLVSFGYIKSKKTRESAR
ncbi:TerC family protein [Metabacillus malikii]|uniref:YjbE family integral membrane protein n=1 Tax=Metabacillus malikii TaxID=1504265 RepID=A0ABT9ZBY1_9BACI|nr:TerC family protein [Metabacillus malikii]MDQ0229769.1 YjbE family integral membrane protein [Metabacillus malikii]